MKVIQCYLINLLGLLILNFFIGVKSSRAFGKASFTSSSGDSSAGTIKVPEGIHLYPKILKQVAAIPSEFTTSTLCFVDSAVFPPSNGLRTQNKPHLFGVRWGKPAYEPTSAPANTTTLLVTSTLRKVSAEVTLHSITQSTETTSKASPPKDFFDSVASTHAVITVTSAKRPHAFESEPPFASSVLNSSSPETIASTNSASLLLKNVTVTTPIRRYNNTSAPHNSTPAASTSYSTTPAVSVSFGATPAVSTSQSSTSAVSTSQSSTSAVSTSHSSTSAVSTSQSSTSAVSTSQSSTSAVSTSQSSTSAVSTSHSSTSAVSTSHSSTHAVSTSHSSTSAVSTSHSSTSAVFTPNSTLVPSTTTETNTTNTTPAHEGSSTIAPSNKTWLNLVQLYDLDREKADHHLVTVQCRQNGTIHFLDSYVIEVEDINDNTPVFTQSSMTSLVPASLNLGEAAMYVQATDADIGLNAELRYSLIPGTEKLTFRNNKTTRSSGSLYVLPSGYVLAFGDLIPDTDITFAVEVKDRGSRNDGNRATATATISIFKDFPPPLPHTAKSSSWMKYTFPIVGVVVILAVGVIVYVIRKRRSFRRRPMLVIDDCTHLDNSELDRFGDSLSNNRDDDDVLIT